MRLLTIKPCHQQLIHAVRTFLAMLIIAATATTANATEADTITITTHDTIVVRDTIYANTPKYESTQDTISTLNKRIQEYEKRLARREKTWMSFIPNIYRFQYAGSVGLVNIGMGWRYGKHQQWETDFMFGYVPKYDKEDAFATFTIRQTYVPWQKDIIPRTNNDNFGVSWQPLSCGLFVNSVLRGDYWTKEPKRYPNRDYYRFSSKLRFHLFVGQRYTLHIPKEKRWLAKDMSLTWELSTCDLYVVSSFVNKTLPVKDILSLSFGVMFGI